MSTGHKDLSPRYVPALPGEDPFAMTDQEARIAELAARHPMVLHTGPSAESLCEIAKVAGDMQIFANALRNVRLGQFANQVDVFWGRILTALGTREEPGHGRPSDTKIPG